MRNMSADQRLGLRHERLGFCNKLALACNSNTIAGGAFETNRGWRAIRDLNQRYRRTSGAQHTTTQPSHCEDITTRLIRADLGGSEAITYTMRPFDGL